MNMITVCAWTAGIFSGTKCNHFPIFFLFSIISFFFLFIFYGLRSLLLSSQITDHRQDHHLNHSASAGFMESVILNREYLA